MIEEKRLIDTNILVYAYDKASEKHAKVVMLLKDTLLSGNCVASIQNLAEFSRLVTEKLPKIIPFEQARNILLELSECLEIIYYDAHTVADALSLCESHKIHFFDALIAATMENEKIRIIITENEKDFVKIPWLTVINPFKD